MWQIPTMVLVATAVGATLGLVGCDQVRSNLAAVIQPKTAKDALEAATRAFVAGDYPRTIEEASAFVDAGGEQQGKLALLMARAYAATSKPDQAIRYLYVAAKAAPLDRLALMNDPSFATLATDSAFIAFVAGASDSSAGPAPQAKAEVSPNGVSVQIGPHGTSATAGGVSVRISP